MTITLFTTTVVKAQKQFSISDLQKMCDFSLAQMKTYALAQKLNYSNTSASDNDFDRYSYSDGTNITTIQKDKKTNLLIINSKSKEYFLKIKESLVDFGYKYSKTTEGTLTFIYYQSDNYKAVLYFNTNNSNKDEYSIAVSKLPKVKCEEFTVTELENICDFEYGDFESLVTQKGYQIIQADNSKAVATCNFSKVNGLIFNISKDIALSNNTYGTKIISELKSKNYKLSLAPTKQKSSTVSIYSNNKYDVYIVEKDKVYSFTFSKKVKISQSDNDNKNSEEATEKVIAKKVENGKLEIDSYTNSTDINIKKGEEITITANGSVTYGAWAGSGGPDGINGYTSYNRIQGFRHGCLLVRVGDKGEWQSVGTSKTIVAANNGILQFIVNDGDPSNNSGAFTVDLTIITTSGELKKVYR